MDESSINMDLEKTKTEEINRMGINNLRKVVKKLHLKIGTMTVAQNYSDALIKNFQLTLVDEKEKNFNMALELQNEIAKLRGLTLEYSKALRKNYTIMFENDTEIQRLTAENNMSDYFSLPSRQISNMKLSGWLLGKKNIPKHEWTNLYIFVSSKKMFFYDPDGDNSTIPLFILDLNKVFHVRPITSNDVNNATLDQIPRMFEILYGNEGEFRRPYDRRLTIDNVLGIDSILMEDDIDLNGHDFIHTTFHTPTDCILCPRPLWNIIRPPPALECKNCGNKIHADHLDKFDITKIAPCSAPYNPLYVRELLLLADSVEEQKRWISELWHRVRNCEKENSLANRNNSSLSRSVLQCSTPRDITVPPDPPQHMTNPRNNGYNAESSSSKVNRSVVESPLIPPGSMEPYRPNAKNCCSIS